tara:strand:+ start:672 stop:1418 length:747 start_codon:yes stop_codon:yes gene_type:complete
MKLSGIINFIVAMEKEYGTDNLPICIAFCSYSGIILEPWLKAGYICLLIDKRFKDDMGGMDGMLLPKGDEKLYKYGCDIDELILDDVEPFIIFSAAEAPCTHLTYAGARWFKQKDAKDPGLLAREAGRLKRLLEWQEHNSHYAYMEQPRGRAPKWLEANGSRGPDKMVEPHWFAGFSDHPDEEAYTKKTYLWLQNIGEIPMDPVQPVLGDKTTKTSSRGWKRSQTPSGLARAIFHACHSFNNNLDYTE